MPLIDKTYFIGDINIPNTDNVAVSERLNFFIESMEQELLIDVLGYAMYKAFINGLLATTIEQRWLDLLQGVDFTNNSNKLDRWPGFISAPLSTINAADANYTAIIVGRGLLFNSLNQPVDPIAGSSSAYIPDSLVGKTFVFEQRGFGVLLNQGLVTDEYSIAGNQIQLLGGKIFSIGDVYLYKSSNITVNPTVSTTKKSVIANYVYFYWLRDQERNNAGLGVVKANAENATPVDPSLKMINAWNQMSSDLIKLQQYLQKNVSVFPEWDQSKYSYTMWAYKKQNKFSI